MKLHARENMIGKGVCKDKQCKPFDIEKMSNELYDLIKNNDEGYDQRELMQLLAQKGWEEADYHLVLGLLQHKHKIVYVAD